MEIKEIEKFGIDEKVLQEYIDKANNGEYIVALLGEFSSGKSTFINAYLDKRDLIPHLNVDCTPVLIDVCKSDEDRMVLKFDDGRDEELQVTEENLKRYAIYDEKEGDKSLVSIHLELNSEELEEGYHLVDTPGMNTIHKEHEYITKSIMRKTDVVIYMINMELTELDLEKLKEIKKYTEEIIFVISHMDKQCDEKWVDRDKDDIETFVKLAEETLKENGFDPIVLPVGSKSAYENRSMINEVKNMVHTIIKESTENEFKNRIKRQVEMIFEMQLKKLEGDYTLNKRIIEAEKGRQEFDIGKVKRKIENIEKKQKWDEEKLEKYKNDVAEELLEDIKRIYKNVRLSAEKVIERDIESLDEGRLTEVIENFEKEINERFKCLIDEKTNEILKIFYKEMNEQIKEVYEEVYIQIDSDIETPTIEEFNIEMDKDLIRTREKRAELMEKEAQILDTINAHKNRLENIIDSQKGIEEEIKEADENEENNVYVPEYEERENNEGREFGGKTGRFVGEIVDMAMFVWAPQGVMLKVADKLKDGVKIASYIGKALETGDKVNKACKEKKGKGLLEVFDILSAGGIGERIGAKIGDAMKPYEKTLIENEEKKKEWEINKERIAREKEVLAKKEEEIREKIEEEEISRLQAIKERESIKRLKADLKEKEDEMRKDKEEEQDLSNKENIIKYYKGELEKISEKEALETFKRANEVLMTVSTVVSGQCQEEVLEKINQLKEKIELLNGDKEELEKEIASKEILITELKEYPRWVNEWI